MVLLSSLFAWHSHGTLYAQSQSKGDLSSSTTSKARSVEVTVSSTASVQVSNATLDAKNSMLKNAVMSFISSGPNVLKVTPSDQPLVKTKIANQISNTTQSVEGIEATYAIIGVEVYKALKTLIASTTGPNQTAIVTIGTTSKCTPSDGKLISCDNTVNIK
jgi:hypothetical protein